MRRYGAVEELDPKHALDHFDCGSDAQTTWLRRHALQAQYAGMARVYVVRRIADDRVAGFYALTTSGVFPAEAPTRVVQGTGRYDIPVIVLTRLGVDLADQGEGLGRALVVDAFRRVERASQEIGVRALLIHAEDRRARAFYEGLAAFEPSPVDDRKLLLLMKDLRRALRHRSGP